MSRALERFLSNDQRAGSIVVWTAAAVVAVCFVGALVAMLLF